MFSGNDYRVRVVDVFMMDKTYRRLIQKLIHLVNKDSSSFLVGEYVQA